MIIDIIKKDVSYVGLLKKELEKGKSALERDIIQAKIKMMEKKINTTEIPTWKTQEITLKRFKPTVLPDDSLSFPLKDEILLFIEKIVLHKEFEWGEYGGLFSGISENKEWFKDKRE